MSQIKRNYSASILHRKGPTVQKESDGKDRSPNPYLATPNHSPWNSSAPFNSQKQNLHLEASNHFNGLNNGAFNSQSSTILPASSSTGQFPKKYASSSLPSKSSLQMLADAYRSTSVERNKLKNGNSAQKRLSTTESKRGHPPLRTDDKTKRLTLGNKDNSGAGRNARVSREKERTGSRQAERPTKKVSDISSVYMRSQFSQRHRNLVRYNQKLQQICRISTQKIFVSEFSDLTASIYKDALRSEQKITSPEEVELEEEMIKAFKLLTFCFERRATIRESQKRNEYSKIEEANALLELQNRRKKSKLDALQKQCESLQQQNSVLMKTVKGLEVKYIDRKMASRGINTEKKSMSNFGVQTDYAPMLGQSEVYSIENIPLQQNYEADQGENAHLIKCIKQLRDYATKQKKLVAVLSVLQQQGVDVETAYQQVINKRLNENLTSEEEADQLARLDTPPLDYDKLNMTPHDGEDSAFADTSGNACGNLVISSTEAMSFRFEGKPTEQQVYTVRNEPKPMRELKPDLKKKLQLDLNRLYDRDLDQGSGMLDSYDEHVPLT